MREIDKRTSVRRRVFLRRAATAPAAAAVVAAGASIAPEAAWAQAAQTLKPATMATLVRVARDIYPHDRLADRYYVTAVQSLDTKAATNQALRGLLEDGAASLDAAAKQRHGRDYIRVGMEDQRVALLRAMEESAFFQQMRGDLVVSLYNQKEVWPKFGYEGSSFEHGGYLHRGFNDIDWLPEA
jgi:hypothetical protein